MTRIDTTSDAAVEYPLPAPGPHAPHGVSVKEDGSEVWVALAARDQGVQIASKCNLVNVVHCCNNTTLVGQNQRAVTAA